jgi:hypothetical protein
MSEKKAALAKLRVEVDAASQEFELAMQFHEVWKPAAYDQDLHGRMSNCLAGNAFLIVRKALRREMLLALMRLWDKDSRAVRMESIAATLRKKSVIHGLATERLAHLGLPEAEGQMLKDMTERAEAAVRLIEKYSNDGTHAAVRESLKTLRDERLAHRKKESATSGPDATDGEIESFYQDNSQLIHLLLDLVVAIAYDPQHGASVYREYSRLFWASARGETTDGHPNYRERKWLAQP